MVFSCNKFQSYIHDSRMIVYTDHAFIRYLFAKKDARPRFIWCILLLQKFDLKLRDMRGSENAIANNLSRLENDNEAIRVNIE